MWNPIYGSLNGFLDFTANTQEYSVGKRTQKVNRKHIRIMYWMLMSTLKTQEQSQPILRSSVVTANFEQIQFLKFFFPTWSMYLPVGNGFAHIRLELKNCLFAITQPTQHWIWWFKIFYWTSESKKFPKVTGYSSVKFYFSNACLNSIEHIYYFSQQKIKRADVWFPVSNDDAMMTFLQYFPFHTNATVRSSLTAIWLQENLWKY